MLLILVSLLLVALVLPACQKKYSKDEEGLLQLQCNASDMQDILDDVGKTEPSETEVKETDPKPTESEPKETEPEETVKPTAVPVVHAAPVVTATARADGVKVSWEKIAADDLSGYKVVYSKTNPNPKYPDDGYYVYITDADTTSSLVKASKVDAGDYYFSVTALYDDGTAVAGNAVRKTMPEYVAPTPSGDRVKPTVSVSVGTDYVKVSWSKITSEDLVGYKVVASVGNSNPKYSEDGYYTWITNRDTTSCKIYNGNSYNGGDIDCFSGGTYYYFSVTAVYGDEWQKVAGNAVLARMPGEATPTPTPIPEGTYPASTVYTPTSDGVTINISWAKTADITGFQWYKVMVSKTNTDPKYPESGEYWRVVDNPNTTSASFVLADNGVASGETLYIRISTGYDSQMAHGNVVTYVVPVP